jgi:hypothetical protein
MLITQRFTRGGEQLCAPDVINRNHKETIMRFQPGQSGNPNGRPRGSRNRRALFAEALYEERAQDIVNKVVELALAGDGTALRVCMDRILAPMRERPVEFELPAMTTAADAVGAMSTVVQGVADGDLMPREAARLATVVQEYARTISTAVIERELRQLLKDQK